MKKVARKLGVLYRSFKLLNVPARVAFVRSIIQPDLDYCSSICNDGSAGISAKLQRIEKRCLRVLDGCRGREICFRFEKADISSTYGTLLSASGVILSRPHTEALRRTLFYRAQCFWNSLPSSLRTISNRVVFRYRLRNYICMLD